MNREVSEKELLERLAALPREIRPGRDPWSGISVRIGSPVPAEAKRTAGRHWPMAAIAASVLLALFVAFTPRDDALDESLRAANETAARSVVAAGTEAVPAIRWAAAEKEYLAAFREFAVLRHAGGGLAPPALENARAGWLELQAAESALQAALRRHPNDRFLNDRMLELRSRQLDFLRQIVAVDRGRRSDMI